MCIFLSSGIKKNANLKIPIHREYVYCTDYNEEDLEAIANQSQAQVLYRLGYRISLKQLSYVISRMTDLIWLVVEDSSRKQVPANISPKLALLELRNTQASCVLSL